MKGIIKFFATPSLYLTFHCFCLAIFFTGIVILLTASELGTVQVFMVPMGLYTIIFAFLCEALLFFRFLSMNIALSLSARLERKAN